MKVTELRVGNWLNNCGQYCFVMSIYKNNKVELGYFEDSIGFVRSLDNLELKPIPLTEEWLLKFGFVETDNKWFEMYYFTDCHESAEKMVLTVNLVSNRCGIGNTDNEDGTYVMTAKRINYVHQLQNLYWCLCGEELEVKL